MPRRCTCRIFFRHFCISEVRKHHGVIACEGSMFKSKFANALTTMMIGVAGHRGGGKQTFHRLWRRSGRDGSDVGATVRALLPPVADDHAQSGIAGGAERTGSAERTGDGHGVDV